MAETKTEFLMYKDKPFVRSGNTIYYGHPIDNSEIHAAFERIAEKYFADIYYDSIDYEVGTVDPDEEYIIDPEMATLAD